MSIIDKLREQTKGYKPTNKPWSIYLSEEDYNKYYLEISNIPEQLWFSGIVVLKEGDTRTDRQIIDDMTDKEAVEKDKESFRKIGKKY